VLRLAASGSERAPASAHDPRGIDQTSSQSRPRRVVAIVKADVRRPDTGRAQRHVGSRPQPIGPDERNGNGAATPRRRGRVSRAVRKQSPAALIAAAGSWPLCSGEQHSARAGRRSRCSPRALVWHRRGSAIASGRGLLEGCKHARSRAAARVAKRSSRRHGSSRSRISSIPIISRTTATSAASTRLQKPVTGAGTPRPAAAFSVVLAARSDPS
jgi:hypothetical protein